MQLGFGYWSLPSIDRRIVDIESRKPRHWQKRLKALKAIRLRVVKDADTTRLVKGWKGRKRRQERVTKIRELLNNSTLAAVGKKFGISRQRVHQIISQWK